jgi:hypothetical protein
MKKLLFIVFLLGGICATQAQKKAVNQATSAINLSTPDYVTAEKLIKEALVNNETMNDAITWYTAGRIYIKKYEDELNKRLLKQNFNEQLMYESFFNAYNYWLKCLVLDKLPNAKGEVKPKYEKEILSKLKKYLGTLVEGGQYFYGLKKFETGFQYFDAYNRAVTSADLQSLNLSSDPNSQKIPYSASLCAVNLDLKTAIQALELAKKTDFEKYKVYCMLYNAYKKDGQEEKYINLLKDGISLYPDSAEFINEFTDNSILRKDADNASIFIQEVIAKKPTYLLYIALGRLYQEVGKPEDLTKSAFQNAINKIPDADQANYYMGLYVVKIAENIAFEAMSIKDNKIYQSKVHSANQTFLSAIPYFIKASEIRNKVEYLIPLRSIYLRFKMDAEYKAVDMQIKKLL